MRAILIEDAHRLVRMTMLAELGRILPVYTRTKSLFNFHTEPIGVFGLWIFIISLVF